MMIHEFTRLLQSRGADLIGFANLSELSSDVRESFSYGISIAVALDPRMISGIQEGPTHEYYAEYKRANHLLDALGHHAEAFLQERGYQARCLAVTEAGIDLKTHSTRLPHKTVATRAGLGWIGKCALLVTKSFGAAVRVTTVLTNAELPAGEPIDTSECGTCQACVDACPAQAPSGRNWQVTLHRDQFFDVFACRAMAQKMAATRIAVDNTICGICIASCPWTKKYIQHHQIPDIVNTVQ